MKRAVLTEPNEPSPVVRRTLMRAVIVPSWVVVGVVALLFASGLEIDGPAQYAPFALSLVFLGLPHGAVDHLVPGRLRGNVTAHSIAGVALLYAALAAIYLALWSVAPVAAFIFFVLLTWFHWGQGDLYSQRTFLGQGEHPVPVPLKVLTAVVRGGLPMLVPLLAFPGVYRGVAESVTGLFSEAGWAAWVFGPAFRGAVGAVFFVLVLISLAWGYRRSGADKAAWGSDAAEVSLLAAYFTLVPPIFAVGLYFCLWHAPRHIARLMLINPSSAATIRKGTFLPALRDFFRDAAPLTAAALALLAGLYLLVPGDPQGPAGLLAVYLVLISVLTLPHVAIVGLMDRHQGLWR